MKKGFTYLPLIIIIAAVLAFGTVAYFAFNKPVAKTNVNVVVNTNTTVDATEDWKTYTNSQFGFQLKHPTDWTAKTINGPYYNGQAILSALQNPGFKEPYGAVGGIFVSIKTFDK